MNQPAPTQTIPPEQQAAVLAVRLEEAEVLVTTLRNRCASLNYEVKQRDVVIRDQQQLLTDLQARVQELEAAATEDTEEQSKPAT